MGALEKGGEWAELTTWVDHPENSIDVRVQSLSFQVRVFSIPSKVQGQKILFNKAIL